MTFWNTGYIITVSNNPENSGSGDPIHDAFTKVNTNFSNISAQLASVNQDWLNANVSYNTNLNYANIANLFVSNKNFAALFRGEHIHNETVGHTANRIH